MEKLGLVLGVVVASIGFALFVARPGPTAFAGSDSVGRLMGSLSEARRAIVAHQARALAIVSFGVAGLFFVAQATHPARAGDAFASRAAMAGWGAAAILLGAGSSLTARAVGLRVAGRAITRAIVDGRTSLDLAIGGSLRAGACLSVLVVALAALGHVGLLGAAWLVAGRAPAIVTHLPPLLLGYALGASIAALLAQAGGIGASEEPASLGIVDDASNVALVAQLSIAHAGATSTRAAELFESIVAEGVASGLLAAALCDANAEALGRAGVEPLALVLFPLVARAFGLVASMVGVMAVKADEDDEPIDAIMRGFYVTAMLAVCGLVAAAFWLDRAHWRWFSVAAAIGVLCSWGFLLRARYHVDRERSLAHLDAHDAHDAKASAPTQLSLAVQRIVVPALVVAATMLAAYKCGERTGLEGGGLFGGAIAMMGLLAPAAYLGSVDAMTSIALDARALVPASDAATDRCARLGDAAGELGALTRSWSSAAAGVVALSVLAALRATSAVGGGGAIGDDAPSSSALELPTTIALLVGGVLSLAIASLLLRAGDPVEAAVDAAARRSVEGLPRDDDGNVSLPLDFKADHASCVARATDAALRSLVAPGLLSVALPTLVGLTLSRFLDLGAASAHAFLAAAVVVCLLIVFALDPLASGEAGDDAISRRLREAAPALRGALKLVPIGALVLAPLLSRA